MMTEVCEIFLHYCSLCAEIVKGLHHLGVSNVKQCHELLLVVCKLNKACALNRIVKSTHFKQHLALAYLNSANSRGSNNPKIQTQFFKNSFILSWLTRKTKCITIVVTQNERQCSYVEQIYIYSVKRRVDYTWLKMLLGIIPSMCGYQARSLTVNYVIIC